MKKPLIILACLSISLLSCKKEGCIDETATNYNSEANKDNGTCTYSDAESATAQVWTYQVNDVIPNPFGNPIPISYETEARIEAGEENVLTLTNFQDRYDNQQNQFVIQCSKVGDTWAIDDQIIYQQDDQNGNETFVDFRVTNSGTISSSFIELPYYFINHHGDTISGVMKGNAI